LIVKYAVPLALIPAVAGLIGFSLFGFSYGFGSFTVPLDLGIQWAIVTYVLSLFGVYVIAFIMDLLAPNFNSTKDMNASMKVVVYSFTASWVGGIFNIIPALSLLGALAGIYSLVLLYQGMKIVKQVSQDKLLVYFITVIISAIIVYAITGWITTSLVFGSRLTPVLNPY